MAILYQGTPFFRGNEFVDLKGNKLIFEKQTKKGKLFKSDKIKGLIALTENQVNKLKSVNQDKKMNIINEDVLISSTLFKNVELVYDVGQTKRTIPLIAIKLFNVVTNREAETTIGYLCLHPKFSEISLSHLNKEAINLEGVAINFNDESSDYFFVSWSTKFHKIDDDTYLMIFEVDEKVKL